MNNHDSFFLSTSSPCVSPELLCLLLNGLSVFLALDVQLVLLEPNELEDRDLPRLSELTFFVLLVAVLLQSATRKQQSANHTLYPSSASSFFLTLLLFSYFLPSLLQQCSDITNTDNADHADAAN